MKEQEAGKPMPMDVVFRLYPERNTIHSYPFVRVLDTKKRLLCDFWTLDLAKTSAKLNNWHIVEMAKMAPAETVKEEPKDDE